MYEIESTNLANNTNPDLNEILSQIIATFKFIEPTADISNWNFILFDVG